MRRAVLIACLSMPAASVASSEWPGDEFYADWFGGHLRSLGEPFLHEATPGGDEEVYRMLVLPSFDHPVSIRVSGNTSRAVVRMTDGWGGYGPGKLSFARVVAVSSADLVALRAALRVIDFWSMVRKAPLQRVIEPDGVEKVIVCADGTTIVLEAVAGGRYHMIHRGCSSTDDLSAVVDVFKRIAGRHLPEHLR